jgi:transcriptional regulator with XRE-family HTH domain
LAKLPSLLFFNFGLLCPIFSFTSVYEMRKRPTPTRRQIPSKTGSDEDTALNPWVLALAKARENKDLTLQQAAERVGVTKAFWHQVEKGKRIPSPGLATLMATVVGLSKTLRDQATSASLRSPYTSKGFAGIESAIFAALASTGWDVQIQPTLQMPVNFKGSTTRPDALVTFPDGTRAAIEIKLLP